VTIGRLTVEESNVTKETAFSVFQVIFSDLYFEDSLLLSLLQVLQKPSQPAVIFL
jgi:hypothetical protein